MTINIKASRPGTITLVIPIIEPSRACNGAERVMLVTMPAPPPGVTFDRQGVKA